MTLAEQMRARPRRLGRPVTSTATFEGQATTQENVNSALKTVDNGSLSYIDQQIASFSTSISAVFEPKVIAGSAAQFYRGNKTWSAVAISDVTGLSAALSGLSDAAAGKVAKSGDVMTGPLIMPSYLKAALPSASVNARSQIYVSDLTGGAEFCYSDGTSWRRMSDRSLVN